MDISRDILIVDDDKQVREVLHQIFLTAGYNCRLAQDGREGVAMFKSAHPPLTVTDLKMPNMGGIELLQQVRAVDQDAAVIVLTGAADVKTAIESLKLGAYDFIMKPVNVDELLIAADRALERRSLLVETSKAGARLYADRIREVVAKYPFSHGKVITASFGVASLPDDEAATAEDLFRAADEALYTAKRAGKNQVAATPSPQRVT